MLRIVSSTFSDDFLNLLTYFCGGWRNPSSCHEWCFDEVAGTIGTEGATSGVEDSASGALSAFVVASVRERCPNVE